MWRYYLLCPIYLVAALLPLLTPFGRNFEYEYALLASYLIILMVPLLGLLIPKAYLPVDGHGKYSPNLYQESLWTFLLGPLVGFIPGALAFWSGACACSGMGYSFWMMLLWYPAFIIAHAFFHGFMRLRVMGIRPFKIGAFFVLGIFLMAGILGCDLWFSPQKRALNLLGGFLHGPIYDSFINLDEGIILGRVSHLLIGLFLLNLVWLRGQLRMMISAVVIAGAFIITSSLAAQYPSVSIGKKKLDQVLPGTVKGDGFTLHFYRPTPLRKGEVRLVPRKIKQLVYETQFHLTELKSILGQDVAEHIEIYVYPDESRKKLWFGGGSTDVTDVVTPSIHITEKISPHPTLRHELVHALASKFAYKGLGFHPNMAFTEGLAEALAPTPRSLNLDDGAASLLVSGKIPDLNKLFSPTFWTESGTRAYTVAGSFIKYLIDTEGIEGVKKLYSGASWEESFSKNREDVINAWKDKITRGYNPEEKSLFAESLFRNPGVFQDLCPHSKADLQKERSEGTLVRMRQPLGFSPETDYYPWLMKLDPNDRSAHLQLWTTQVEHAAVNRFASLSEMRIWSESLSRIRKWPPETMEDIELALLESDLLRLVEKRNESINILKEIMNYSQKVALGDQMLRQVISRIYIEENLPEAQALPWRRYLAGWRDSLPDKSKGSEPWLLTYLRLRRGQDSMVSPVALRGLYELSLPDPSLPMPFHLEWYRLLGNRMMDEGIYGLASESFEKAAALAPSGRSEVLKQHARRAQYYAKTIPSNNSPSRL